MYCSKCGNKLGDSVKFCPQCGAELKTAEPSDRQVNTPPSQTHTPTPDQAIGTPPSSSDYPASQVRPSETGAAKTGIFNRKYPLRMPIIVSFGILVSFLLVILGFSLFYYLSPKQYEPVFAANLEEDGESEISQIIIKDTKITLMSGQSKQLQYDAFPLNADRSNVTFSSSNPDVTISDTGIITSGSPGQDTVITVSSGAVSAAAEVHILTAEESFFETIEWLSNKTENSTIYFYEQNYTPNEIKANVVKDESVDIFSKINSEISGYGLEQKRLINGDTQNIVDCDMYYEQTTGDIRKIVSIEYYSNYLEITDYYYLNGKVYFAFRRHENYYRPVYAQLDMDGSRYYFLDDAMVAWRTVETPHGDWHIKTDNFFIDTGLTWKVYEYEKLNGVENEKAEYTRAEDDEALKLQRESDYMEHQNKMLNAAYNIYNRLASMPLTVAITGYVMDMYSNPLSGAMVKLFSEEHGMLTSQVLTDGEGGYVIDVPISDKPYTILIQKDDCQDTYIYNVMTKNQSILLFQEIIYMYPKNSYPIDIGVNLVNAIDGRGIFSGLLHIREGINNRDGDVIKTVNLNDYFIGYNNPYADGGDYDGGDYDDEDYNEGDAFGSYSNPRSLVYLTLQSGNYTAEILSPGMENIYFTITTVAGNIQSNIIPKIDGEQMSIVLSWSANPSDLDSHLFLPDDKHVAYYSKAAGEARLDIDMTSGYGPETITIDSLRDGTYKYYVANYSDLASGNYSSTRMSNSSATVSVYTKDGLVANFWVPRNKEGGIWHVFNILNGRISPVQRYFNNVEDMPWWTSVKTD